MNQCKRCIECGSWGHFKCTTEQQSLRVKLTFCVENNLDEFFVGRSHSDSESIIPQTDDDIDSELDRGENKSGKGISSKREQKAKRK